jgi:hypothetical protein
MADNENSPDQKSPSKVVKEKKKKERETEGLFLPLLVEFTFTFSAILLILLFLTIISVSLLTGTKLLDIVIRTSVAMLVIGGLLMLISHQISLDVLNVNNVKEEAVQIQSEEPKASEEVENYSPSEVL